MAVSKRIDGCPILLIAGIIGKKWSIPIIEEIYLSDNKAAFNKILKALKTITPRNLSGCLKELHGRNFVERKSVKENNIVYVRYSLTKKGKDLRGLIKDLKEFGFRYYGKRFKDCGYTKCSKCGFLYLPDKVVL